MKFLDVITFGLCLIFITGLMYLIFAPFMDVLSECEKRGWDGSEHNTGQKDLSIGENFGKDIIIKCNKAEKETDVMVEVFDALPFIEIKDDAKEANQNE